jgi:16S rRNA A1518/A1519 N6-dimethyltransferase RsmA/KsgA/DIM1 with predicted DNA glycosylase/AP lyase activity
MKSSEYILERLDELDFDTVLEVGCGFGGLTEKLLGNKALSKYYACDTDEECIIELTKRLYSTYLQFSAHTVNYLKLHCNPLDLVIASHVLEPYRLGDKKADLIKILDKMCQDSKKYVVHTCVDDPVFMEYWLSKKEEWSVIGYNMDEIRKVIIAERI